MNVIRCPVNCYQVTYSIIWYLIKEEKQTCTFN